MKNNLVYDILIPAYNAGQTISKILTEINTIEEKPGKIFVVNDGSEDGTAKVCQEFGVTVISHVKNMGKGRALKTGFEVFLKESQSEFLICMDADLQHPVSSIPNFLEEARSGHLFIIGSRDRSPKTMPFHRIVSNTLTSFILSKLTGQKIEDSQSGYRMLHRDVLQKVKLKEDGYQLESEMLLEVAQNDIKTDFVPIPTIYNDEKSHMRNFSDTIKFIRLIIIYFIKNINIFSRKDAEDAKKL